MTDHWIMLINLNLRVIMFIFPLRSLENIEKMMEKMYKFLGFPGGAVVKNLPANAGDTGSSPGLGRSHMPQSS